MKALLSEPERYVRVSALYEGRVYADFHEFRPTHIISLLDPAIERAKIPSFPDALLLQRYFNDGDKPSEYPLTPDLMLEIVAFLRDWFTLLQRGAEPRLLVHCHMGASRSTAVALVALAIAQGEHQEAEAFADLLKITSKPWPNPNVVSLADDILQREGRLVDQLKRYRTGYPNRLAAYRRLNSRRGLV